MQILHFIRPNTWCSRTLALLLTLILGLGLRQPAQAQTVPAGYVQGWGWNHVGQLDIPADLSDVIAVAASQVHSLALKSDGTVVAWGSNVDGQINVPAGLSNVIAISAGGDHSMALKSDGTVVAWGANTSNQLDIPAGLTNVIAIAAGDFHSLALKSNGEVVAWGCGGGYDFGQCTVPASALSGVTAIAAGAAHSLALKNDGSVVAWGRNFEGETTVPASALSGVVAIAANSGAHNLALKNDGTVVAWGRNSFGQTDVPAGLNNVIAIATGHGHSLALKNDGTVVAWGNNSYGQTDIPDGLTGVVGIAGGWHTLVIVPPPSVTINQAADQADPTTTNPILFTATFSKAVTDFTAADVALSGTANLTGATLTISGGPSVYTISVAGVAGNGTVIASLAADVATDANGYGNRASTSTDNSVTLNLNPSPPLLTPNVVGTLGNNGWYVSNVTLAWTVAENGAAISSQSGCETQNITSDTSGITFTCTATSVNGGSSSESVTIQRDATAPTISAAATSNPNAAGWYNSDVTVHFTCADNLSGVTSCPADQVLSSEGAAVASTAQTITDQAGNSVTSNIVTVKIDKTAPTISAVAMSNPNAAGWYNSDVTVNWSCSDVTSGVVAANVSQTLSSDGANQSATGVCTDNAGNSSAPNTQSGFNIDKTAPTISAAATTAPNAAGWYNSDVTVHFTCADNLSGVTSCPADETLSSEGDAVVSTAQTITDQAGNSSTSNIVTVKIDKTAPTISAAATTPPNAAGWYNSDVTVSWSCSDVTSGVVAANVSQTLSSDGTNQSATGVCTDNAGNSSAPDTQSGFNIDKTAPTISAAATTAPNAAGWYNSDVTVHFTCADNLSGVTSCPADQTLSSEGAAVASTAQTITDQAGNSNTSNIVTVKIDKTAPTISAAATSNPNAAGWYNSNVTIRFTCTDALAGVANCPADQVLSSEGTAIASMAQTVTDRAGNTSADSNVVTVKVDKTAPVVTVTGVTSGATYPAGGVPTAGCTTDDALSGVATQADTVLVTGGNAVGTALFILTCRGATDNADNLGIGNVNYLIPVAPNLVVGWGNTGAPGDLVNVIAVASGANHSLALKTDGTVVAWGANNAGQSSVPADLSDVIAIAAGIQHSLALKSDGTVVAWGWNSAGQSTVPVNLSGVVTIAAGWQNSMAVKSDGTVVGWGLNNYGQSTAPAGLNDVIAIETGYEHSVALKSDGTVRAWGRNSNAPAGLNNVIAIAAGDYHSLALKSDGTMTAWGMNNNGQSNVPAGLSNVVAIAAGGDLSMALKNDGKVAAWGSNYQGERSVPSSLDHVIAIAAGSFNAQAIKEAITVTINQAAGQADPTASNPVRFDVLFSQSVANFTASDVTLSGTANLDSATITISGGPAAYIVNVDGVAGSGTVIATLAANVATDANGYGNRASTSTDNTVLFVVSTPPTANADSYTTAENTVLTLPAPGVLGNDTDADSNTLTAVKVSDAMHGAVSLNPDGSFSYMPGAGYNGPDSFTYKANDGTADSNVATVAITVNAVNDAPVAVADAFTVAEGGTATTLIDGATSVLSNDTDGDGDALTANVVTGPTNGTLTLNPDGTFSYVHNGSETTSDSFTYQANDGAINSNLVTVTITITPVNDAPLATNDSYSTNEDAPLTMAAPGVLGNDSDADGNVFTVSGITVASHGSIVMNADGSFTYTPALNYNGPDSFTYQVTDGSTESNLATVSITVNAVNDAPVAANDSYTAAEDTVLAVGTPGVLGNDSDIEGSALTASVVALPSHGTLTLNPNGSFSYTPAANFNGTDSFTYKANDGSVDANVATVTLNVTPVEDIPAYGVDNTDTGYAQLVIIDPFTGVVTPFGPRQALDIEDVALHPTTGVLYASTGGNGAKKGWLYRVDRTTGALTAIGQTDGKGVMALTFRASDATLWGWVEGTGLIQIDPTTAKATVVTKNTAKFEGMAWAPNGKLYLARDKTLTEYNPTSKTFTTYATNLSKGTEALDILSNGRLVGAARDTKIALFSYNLTTKQVTNMKTLSGATGFSLKSMEGLTWHASLTPPPGF